MLFMFRGSLVVMASRSRDTTRSESVEKKIMSVRLEDPFVRVAQLKKFSLQKRSLASLRLIDPCLISQGRGGEGTTPKWSLNSNSVTEWPHVERTNSNVEQRSGRSRGVEARAQTMNSVWQRDERTIKCA